jgi:hypothetical protein
LALSPDTPKSPSFAELWAAVVSDEKDRLWVELAVQQPQRLVIYDWQLAPNSVTDDPDLMRFMVAYNVRFALHISNRLAADFAFIDAILAQNLQALMWLPQKAFECFPHIINSNSTLQALKMSGLFYGYYGYTSARQLLINKLSDRQYWNDRTFMLRFAFHTLGVPDRFLKSNDVELYKVLVLSKRLKKKDNEFTYIEGSMAPNTQTCLELLRIGMYQHVRSCFTNSGFMENNYKVWVAKQRFLVPVVPHYGAPHGGEEGTFRAKALDQLQTFQGCFTFMCGVIKSRQEDNDGDDHCGDDCLLRKLDHAGIRAEIASYLDFPKGLELEDLLVAAPKIAPSFPLFHPYDTVVVDRKDHRGVELLQTLDLEPAATDYGHQYAVEQQQQQQHQQQQRSETSSDGPH